MWTGRTRSESSSSVGQDSRWVKELWPHATRTEVSNLTVNRVQQSSYVDDGTEPLLYVLRNKLELKGPKFGCGVAQCGACTVLVNGIDQTVVRHQTEHAQ